jgi:hypothetical protein
MRPRASRLIESTGPGARDTGADLTGRPRAQVRLTVARGCTSLAQRARRCTDGARGPELGRTKEAGLTHVASGAARAQPLAPRAPTRPTIRIDSATGRARARLAQRGQLAAPPGRVAIQISVTEVVTAVSDARHRGARARRRVRHRQPHAVVVPAALERARAGAACGEVRCARSGPTPGARVAVAVVGARRAWISRSAHLPAPQAGLTRVKATARLAERALGLTHSRAARSRASDSALRTWCGALLARRARAAVRHPPAIPRRARDAPRRGGAAIAIQIREALREGSRRDLGSQLRQRARAPRALCREPPALHRVRECHALSDIPIGAHRNTRDLPLTPPAQIARFPLLEGAGHGPAERHEVDAVRRIGRGVHRGVRARARVVGCIARRRVAVARHGCAGLAPEPRDRRRHRAPGARAHAPTLPPASRYTTGPRAGRSETCPG